MVLTSISMLVTLECSPAKRIECVNNLETERIISYSYTNYGVEEMSYTRHFEAIDQVSGVLLILNSTVITKKKKERIAHVAAVPSSAKATVGT